MPSLRSFDAKIRLQAEVRLTVINQHEMQDLMESNERSRPSDVGAYEEGRVN